jgi:hypothetical protein
VQLYLRFLGLTKVEGLPETIRDIGAAKVGPAMEFIADMPLDQYLG